MSSGVLAGETGFTEERGGSAGPGLGVADLRFLSEASRVLASSLDYRTTLATVAQLAVPGLADWNVVDLVEESGGITRVAVAHADPSLHELERAMFRYAPEPALRRGVWQVMQSGRSQVIAEFTDAHAAATARDAAHFEMIRALEVRSYLCVPLIARGRLLGTLMCLTTARSGRRYGAAEVAVAEDLAGRAALAVDNARLFLEAQRASETKDLFLATLSHELRTPLCATLSWVELLRAGQLDERQRERALEVIERSARSQVKLLEELLDVSRIEAGKLDLVLADLELAAAIREAVLAILPAAEAKGIAIALVLDPVVGRVRADGERLKQVLGNLLCNAIKFTPAGGRVEVRIARVGDRALISIQDSGIGIASDLLPHVFERFRQAPDVQQGARGGLGLGLAIVRELMSLHGGSVRVESAGAGTGTTFHLELPLSSAISYAQPAEGGAEVRRLKDAPFFRAPG